MNIPPKKPIKKPLKLHITNPPENPDELTKIESELRAAAEKLEKMRRRKL